MGILDGWRLCPRCGGPLRHGPGNAECEACGSLFWANPVPGAQAVIERDGRVLLGRRSFEPSIGLWDLPGGFLEEHEHPLEGLHREVREETGLEVEPTEFLGSWIHGYDGRTILSLTWLARPTGGKEQAGDDLVELRWFGPGELPGAHELAFEPFAEILSLWRGRQQHA